eukprot:scaffold2708_cov119-Cylindrotheca_fusiformis.AAC.9
MMPCWQRNQQLGSKTYRRQLQMREWQLSWKLLKNGTTTTTTMTTRRPISQSCCSCNRIADSSLPLLQQQRHSLLRRVRYFSTEPSHLHSTLTTTTTTMTGRQTSSSRQSSPTRTTTTTKHHEKWKNMTQRILQHNFTATGSNGRKQPQQQQPHARLWHQAEACLQYWHTQKDLDQCLQILKHLAAAAASAAASSSSSSSSFRISTESIVNPIVKLWRNQLLFGGGGGVGDRSLLLLPSKMSQLLKEYQDCGLFTMDKATHSMILDAASHHQTENPPKEEEEGILFAQAYLSEWIESYQKQQQNQQDNHKENDATFIVQPDAIAIGTVIHGWVESGLPEAPQKAEEWMTICTELLQLQPTTELYTSVIAAWANVGESERAQEWMDRMLNENNNNNNNNSGVTVDLAAWNGLLLAYTRSTVLSPASSSSSSSSSSSPKDSAAERAEGVLKQMRRLYDTKKIEFAPDVVSYTIVLDAWSRQVNKERNPNKRKQFAQRALRLLQEMKDSADPNVSPNTFSYNSVLTTCARAGLVPEAESLLKEMIRKFMDQNDSVHHEMSRNNNNNNNNTIQPNIQSVAILLYAYSRSTMDPTMAAEKAESILKDSIPALGLEPNLQIYNNCISCWAKASTPTSTVPVERATALFHEISERHGMQPDVVTYTALMNVWGRHGKPEEAQSLLNELWKLFRNSKLEDAHLYKPTGQTLTTVLHAWSSCDPEKTEALLQRMARDYGISPNVYSYSVVLTAWAKHATSEQYPDAPDRALAILNGMVEYGGIQPNVVSYSTVIQAFAEQGRAKEAESLLNDMLTSADDTIIPNPDMYTFSSVLYAWTKSRSPHAADRAEAILVQMLQLYLAGKLDQPPNVYCYTNVLACLANSKKQGSAHRALQILRSMQQNHAEASNTMAAPNLISYNTVINAFANEIDRGGISRAEVESMVEQVFDLLEELRSSSSGGGKQQRNLLKPDEWTYLSVCKAIRNARTRRNNMKHVKRLLAIMGKEGFEPSKDLKKQIRMLMQ